MDLAQTAPRRFRPRVVAVVGTAALGVALGAAGITAALAATTGAITGYGGKCADVAGANPANGTQVQLYTCNGSGAQAWTVGNSDNSIQALGKCLDVTAAGTANGTKVQLYACNGSNAQKWTATGYAMKCSSQIIGERKKTMKLSATQVGSCGATLRANQTSKIRNRPYRKKSASRWVLTFQPLI